MNYKRGEVVLLPFPFITTGGAKQKARPALIISDHSIPRRFHDLILVGITSQRIDDTIDTEFLIDEDAEYFSQTGLMRSSVVRCEYLMTVPQELPARKLGELPGNVMKLVDKKIKISLGL